MGNIAKGSEWRKWDLHIHTAFTKLSDNYEVTSEEDIWKKFSEKLENSDVEVFGLTDYFCVDNYFIFLEKHKQYFPCSTKKFFANVELRLNVSVNKAVEEVNIHVIFSDKVERNKIEDFLHRLDTTITRNGITVNCRNLTSNEYVSASVNYINIISSLKKVFGEEKCYLIMAAANNQGLRADSKSPRKMAISDEIDKICDGFFGSEKNVTWFLKEDRYESAEKSEPKPVIAGSDAHSFSDIDNFLGKRFIQKNTNNEESEIVKDITWIKAEPIFEGLLQILNEPSRVFIGEIPSVLKRIKNNPTKYINSVEVFKNEGSPIDDIWFENLNVCLNPELVAIIGNKGKGKSALSDIIGLCANAHIDEDDFSFLHKTKFRNPRPNLAKEFTAKLSWEGGVPEEKTLSSNPNFESPERVKYIPQSFLEKLCTSIDKKVFEEELEKVIFSRLEDYQRLGKGSLKEVLNEKKSSLDHEINQLKSDLDSINTYIIELERKNSSKYRRSISESLQAKENELIVHNQKKPSERTAPQENEETQQKTILITTQINEYRNTIKSTQEIKAELYRERAVLEFEVNELDQLVQTFTGLSEYIDNIITTNSSILEKYQLNNSSIFNYNLDLQSIEEVLEGKNERIKEIGQLFSEMNPSNPDLIIEEAEAQINELQNELDEENREYQKYLTELQEWEFQKSEMVGAVDKDDTLLYYQEIKKYLENDIVQDISDAYNERKDFLSKLLQKKESLASLYKDLYKPVSEFIVQNKNELSDYNVNIDVSLGIIDFENKFFNYISNGIAGSFYGTIESRQMLSKLTEVVDFNNVEAVSNWIDEILNHLQYDKRQGQNNLIKKDLGTQLKGGFNEKDFYNFLFSLDYYEPSYELKLGSKNLAELSPGERGALLLIFYLLLDKRDIPIIIDQPEENLDNQSVYYILVHFIKKAKQKRQIIIVTHNPNLAVVCDAEQIIRMDIAKNNKNKVSLITGGIENPHINKAIVDILEGTRPAFNNRTFKYEISK